MKFMEHDDLNLLENLQITKKMEGWNLILDDKCTNNELTDVQNVNMPNLKKDAVSKLDVYIYSAFLPPGYH